MNSVVANTLALGSPVNQASFAPCGSMAALCTDEAVDLLSVPTGVHPKVGSKPRQGPYGGCFHARAACHAAPELNTTPHSKWMLAARPGRRLWVAEAWLDGSDQAPKSAVKATLKPDVPKASRAPGAPEPVPDAKVKVKKVGVRPPAPARTDVRPVGVGASARGGGGTRRVAAGVVPAG
jgi:hypothetical protein